jgi:D-sedoheptulose 7-phosphate isomerase
MEIVVFTNGCFDILHAGHVDLLTRAKSLGTKLIVGINSDDSVRKIKGFSRPIVAEKDRAIMLLALEAVDEVRIFSESTPENLIKEINPNVLVKGGDWKVNEIVGADFVSQNGGKVVSLALREGFSTSKIVEKIHSERNPETSIYTSNYTSKSSIANSISEHITVFELLLDQIESIETTAKIMISALRDGNKVLLCGNGGSAADAQHIATEITGRFEVERIGYPAISLTTDSSALTAIANDYGFEKVFSRQVEAIAKEGDVLIGISTSGNSPNIIAAVMKAREIGCKTIGLTGESGKKLASICDASVLVPSLRTARIQEAHITIGHIWCEMVDIELS